MKKLHFFKIAAFILFISSNLCLSAQETLTSNPSNTWYNDSSAVVTITLPDLESLFDDSSTVETAAPMLDSSSISSVEEKVSVEVASTDDIAKEEPVVNKADTIVVSDSSLTTPVAVKRFALFVDTTQNVYANQLMVRYLDSLYSEIGNLEYFNLDSLKSRGAIFKIAPEKPSVSLTREQALDYLSRKVEPSIWKDSEDPLRKALDRLILEASSHPYSETEGYLSGYSYDNLEVPWEDFYLWDSLIYKVDVPQLMVDSSAYAEQLTDSVVDIYQTPDFTSFGRFKDTTVYVAVDTVRMLTNDSDGFPFTHYSSPYLSDSLQVAINTVMSYLQERDSTIINITGYNDRLTEMWLNSKSGVMTRYWLQNDMNDSVTVWVGAPAHNTIGLYLEQGVNFKRPSRQSDYSSAWIEKNEIDRSTLQSVKDITVKPNYWKTRAEASFNLNQTAMENWVKGGENSFSISTELIGYADYANKTNGISSENFARVKYGIIQTKEYGTRKNVDLLETSSKLSAKAFGKFDFSAFLLFKTTIAKGYNYPNDSIPISKFMNPATLQVGFGLDYKPNKRTSINISPISYKGTFVSDTALINATLYGIEAGRISKHEPGGSFLLSHDWQITKNMRMVNKLQLFTNYIHNPQNIDVDWEMTFTAKLNWFTDFKLNTHLIFDDDTKTPLFDDDDNPVLDGDGNQKKTARAQFKEIIGFSFIFRF